MSGLVPEHEPQGLHGALVHTNHGGVGSHDVTHGCSVRRLVERDHPPIQSPTDNTNTNKKDDGRGKKGASS